MSYNDIRAMAKDVSLVERIAAAAAQESVAAPLDWAWTHSWHLVAKVDWEAAWNYAEAAVIPSPGADEGVITDGMILAAVQAQLAA